VIRIRGVGLPDGVPVDLTADGDRWRADPASGAEVVAEGWVLPGLVDVHTHPGAVMPNDPLREDLLREDLIRHVDAGVTLIRSPGLAGPPPDWFGADPDLPRAYHAGPWLARDGAFFDGGGRRVELDELPAVAAAQAAASGWCKLIGDWRGTDPLPVAVVSTVVGAVHAAGGRVAMHCQHEESCRAAVAAGVDTLEHGQHLPAELIDEMARRGTVWVPTLVALRSSVPAMRKHRDRERGARYVAGVKAMGPNAVAAAEAGVRLLAGTDSRPMGRVVDEVRALAAAGVPIDTALAGASWAAREYLGLAGLVDGAPADAVVYDSDPRADPDVLEHPARVILRGHVVR